MNLTFVANVLNGAMQCLNISIIDDVLVEKDENFTVNIALLNTDNGIVLGNDNDTTLVIRDNEGKTFNLCMEDTLRAVWHRLKVVQVGIVNPYVNSPYHYSVP